MPRRIDVELTSARDDGTWTWRAAGARQPKGTVEAALLYPGAKVGDVVRAEVEMDIDGITILTVQPPKGGVAAPEGRLEILGPSREFEGVTTSLAPKSDRPRRDRGDRPDRGERGDRRGRPDRGGERGGPRVGERAGERGRGDRPDRPDRTGERRPAAARGPRPERGDRPDRGDRGPRPERGSERPERPRPKRLSPGSKHRNAVLDTLSPEQKPIAEQLVRGGIPAVRKAIDEQNAKLKADGLPEIKPEQLLAVAEELLPRIKTAEWRDRADAAIGDVDNIGLRDLRSVVSGADANARDDETRAIAGQLRDALERRLKEERESWLGEVSTALDEGRLVRALRAANRAPDPTMRFPADLAMRLSQAASDALSPDTPVDRWGALLEAVAASPVRTTVKPAGLPADAPESLLHAARQAAGRIPALATLLGLALPPPPTAMKRIPPRPTPPPTPRPTAHPAPAPASPTPTAAPAAVDANERDSTPSTEQSSAQNAEQPSAQNAEQPADQPAAQAPALNTEQPAAQAADQPAAQPSAQPEQPSEQREAQPSEQREAQPSEQRAAQPSEQGE